MMYTSTATATPLTPLYSSYVKSYVSHITMTSIIYIAGELVSATQCLDYISSYICTESILRTPGDVNYKAFSS